MENILSLSAGAAREFFLREECYRNFELPPYFQFAPLLNSLSQELDNKALSDYYAKDPVCKNKSIKPDDCSPVNFKLLNNKDGEYSWRPLQLIHPALYVALVHKITQEDNWFLIRRRFLEFNTSSSVDCASVPVVFAGAIRGKANAIGNWLSGVEQKSIELGLEYEYIFQTDISGCYESIYTHSIAWALHGKEKAKKERSDSSLLGNSIDYLLRSMSSGQTNGIPQGSVLMDFIVEIVLGYVDELLKDKISLIGNEKYKIIRYRDDYRVFVNNPEDGKKIIKNLTEVLIELGLKLNPQKTTFSNNVINSSLKSDKFYSIINNKISNKIQDELYIISDLAQQFPNSGIIEKRLSKLNNKIDKRNKINENIKALISILVDIAYKNPRVYPVASAVLSKFISFLDHGDQRRIIDKIRIKFEKIPNTGYLDLWLQRITMKVCPDIEYQSLLCKKVARNQVMEIWNSEWLSDKLKNIINKAEIINRAEIKRLPPVIKPDEVNIFKQNDYL